MKNKLRNFFFVFGVVAVVIMVFTFDVSPQQIATDLKRAGYYLPLVLLLWVVIYFFNASAWHVILSSDKKSPIPFHKLYKFTITGFALNYVTPGGLMGGEPYRIMEATPYVGVDKASSSVILYVMMHIFSHFLFWMSSVFLFLFYYPVSKATAIILAFMLLFCFLFILLFWQGYKKGFVVFLTRIGCKIPYLKKYVSHFSKKYSENLEKIDSQIALLHRQEKRSFYGALFLEYTARIISCVEVWLILHILTHQVNFFDCILIVSFSSFFANLLFFLPMQVGGREGGFALAVHGLSLSGAYGVYTALITRVRELVWIVIGLILMRIGNIKKNTK
ncbi:MAG: lysylphosphatidylglycerol synthase transmembrane domain-containing protein [Bacteroides sp.]|nr:lysylphosphatidylglycerol synthase transmembrane domain-containing protein [Bacteroides sp.]